MILFVHMCCFFFFSFLCHVVHSGRGHYLFRRTVGSWWRRTSRLPVGETSKPSDDCGHTVLMFGCCLNNNILRYNRKQINKYNFCNSAHLTWHSSSGHDHRWTKLWKLNQQNWEPYLLCVLSCHFSPSRQLPRTEV